MQSSFLQTRTPIRVRRGPTIMVYSVLFTILVAAAPAALPAGPAAAAAVTLFCTGSQHAHYTPGLTNQPQDVQATVNADWDSCIAEDGLTEGHGTFQAINPNASCLVAASIVANVVTYNWNNGDHSTVNFHTTIPARLPSGTTVLTSIGTVTGGFGQGAVATRANFLPQTDLDKCSQPGGVTQLDGPATLTFTL